MSDSFPLAVLISGSGSNLQALIDRRSDAYAITAVISDVPDAHGLRRAERAGIPTEVVRWRDHRDRHAFTEAVCDLAERHGAQALVLAGFMRILAPVAVARFPSAILNVHPALLPAFPGVRAIESAIDHGVKVSGVTVHFVDEEVDHGPIIAQEAVPVLEGDTAAELHARIQEVEHRLLPDAVEAFALGRLRVDGRTVRRDTMLMSEGGG